tara:strand:+ start:1389 stop:1526 length:138 start_codon:yes stop_codon:yes gene_type:complete
LADPSIALDIASLNREIVTRAGLTVSSQLLKLVALVEKGAKITNQ